MRVKPSTEWNLCCQQEARPLTAINRPSGGWIRDKMRLMISSARQRSCYFDDVFTTSQ